MSGNTGLVCPICHKTSENKKSHIRHTSYCRKKARRPPRTRKRSCLACIKAKTHCDASILSPCSRCSQKSIDCSFEVAETAKAPNLATPSSAFVVKVNGRCGNLNAQLAQSEPFLGDWSDSYASSSSSDELETMISLADESLVSTAQMVSPTRVWQFSNGFVPSTVQTGWLPQSSSIYPWTLSGVNEMGPQLILKPPKAFMPKGIKWGKFSLISKYMISTIRAYPTMMLSKSTMPPFIHRVCLANAQYHTHRSRPGPLLRCAGIVELWANKTPNNAHYIWKILRIEQERIMEEVEEYEDMIAINALQAIAIYFLLRVSSQHDEDANFDGPLLQTMTALSNRVRGITMKYCALGTPTRPSWCNWIMVESLQRTIAALFIIEILFDFSPAMGKGACDSLKYWSEMLLPSGKRLWEAQCELDWIEAYDAVGGDQRPLYGELLGHEKLNDSRAALLDRWMSQVDEFGTLVINIASAAEVIR